MDDAHLAVDGVREVILRDAASRSPTCAAAACSSGCCSCSPPRPARTFSKEEIVETVWDVEYHPLRHDAALFTNIMRIRRLLGDDGAELIRVTEDGYRFIPPKDFLFVEPVAQPE